MWSFDGKAVLRPDELPSDKALVTTLRAFCMARAVKRVSLTESRPSTVFRLLRHDVLSVDLANTDTWEYLTEAILVPGAMPDELRFMAGGTYVTTNWIGSASMRRLIELEAEDALLVRMQEERAYPAGDVATILSLCAEALRESWELYFFEPGT